VRCASLANQPNSNFTIRKTYCVIATVNEQKSRQHEDFSQKSIPPKLTVPPDDPGPDPHPFSGVGVIQSQVIHKKDRKATSGLLKHGGLCEQQAHGGHARGVDRT
jgi:hypothetical protein